MSSFTELLEIHSSLRSELRSLCQSCNVVLQTSSSISSLSPKLRENFLSELSNLIKQFDFFFVIFNSHSKAEDDIIIPELHKRCPIDEIKSQIEHEHSGHATLFRQTMQYFSPLRTVTLEDLNSPEKVLFLTQYLSNIHSELVSLMNQILLHLQNEEEELIPLMDKAFSAQELTDIFGKVLGQRPAEVMEGFLNLISRGLSETEKNNTISEMLRAAKGTKFQAWIKQLQLNRTKLPANVPVAPKSTQNEQDMTQMSYGCKHYQRNCKIIAPCCNKLFFCRLCHDEACSHEMNRYEVKTMMCQFCNKIQPVAKHCEECKRSMADYVCLICMFFDSSPTKKYHCPYCNVCRIGKNLGDDFYHCMKCNCCINLHNRGHVCEENKLDKNCMICFDNLFNSTKVIKQTACGHYLHANCFDKLVQNDYRCPVCRKSIVNMEKYWTKFDEINAKFHRENTDVYMEESMTICNECGVQEMRCRIDQNRHSIIQYPVPFKCDRCNSYNTKVV